MPFKVPNQYRLRTGRFASDDSYGNNGAFRILLRHGATAFVIASCEGGWEHVSVSIRGKQRCPRWDEMQAIKVLFWGHDDAVMQLHPPRGDYINNHPFCLHLWRPLDAAIPLPPTIMVGV